MKKIRVALKGRSYDILIGSGLLEDSGKLIKRLNIGLDAVVVTNKRLLGLYGKELKSSLRKSGIATHFELVPGSEKAKSAEVATDLIRKISSYDKNKQIFIIAFGGGVVGDLAGFVAAIYKRGVPYVQVPTTLLAQVDSSIGGKVAIDLPLAKNLAGAFYQPRIVISDVSVIRSLPRREIRAGLSEVIKYGVIKDPALFTYIEKNISKIMSLDGESIEYIVSRSASIKALVVSKDEFDRKGDRAILNFGHTFGHAIESASGYSDNYNHGEAVAVGMIVAARISCHLGLLNETAVERLEALIAKSGLPAAIRGAKLSDIFESHLRDKKFTNKKNRLVLPVRIGRVKIVRGVSEAVIKKILKEHIV